jgi:hypothetical protein
MTTPGAPPGAGMSTRNWPTLSSAEREALLTRMQLGQARTRRKRARARRAPETADERTRRYLAWETLREELRAAYGDLGYRLLFRAKLEEWAAAGWTLQDIGDHLGLSRERIRQMAERCGLDYAAARRAGRHAARQQAGLDRRAATRQRRKQRQHARRCAQIAELRELAAQLGRIPTYIDVVASGRHISLYANYWVGRPARRGTEGPGYPLPGRPHHTKSGRYATAMRRVYRVTFGPDVRQNAPGWWGSREGQAMARQLEEEFGDTARATAPSAALKDRTTTTKEMV